MTNPKANAQRFIASYDGQISLPEIAALLRDKKPDISEKISTKIVPNWIISVVALFNAEGTILASVNSMNKYGIIKK